VIADDMAREIEKNRAAYMLKHKAAADKMRAAWKEGKKSYTLVE